MPHELPPALADRLERVRATPLLQRFTPMTRLLLAMAFLPTGLVVTPWRSQGVHEGTAAAGAAPVRYSGMLPCFLGGFRSRLPSRLRRAAMSLGRVARGWMTSSM